MNKKDQLLARLDAIGQSLKSTGQALALLGLGSVGTETDRIDAYSDLDFFVIVQRGAKARFLESLDWLESVNPISYAFLNSVDGYKALFADGIFCEFAVFEPQELSNIPFAEGRVVWKDDSFDATLLVPKPHEHSVRDSAWLLGEAITNLYVGLGRFRRGEKLSATRFIQGYAVDRLVELTALIEQPQPFYADQFGGERRFEFRFPNTAAHMPEFMQGYDRNIESARAILGFLEKHFSVNLSIRDAILALCDQPVEG